MVDQISDYIPIFSRLEHHKNEKEWALQRRSPSREAFRDIPEDALVHPSVKLLYQDGFLPKGETPERVIDQSKDAVNGDHEQLLFSRNKK